MERIEKPDTVAPGYELKHCCELCGTMYGTLRGLQLHIHKRHSQMLCAVCGERFPSLSKLQKHKKIHRRLYTCRICPYTSYCTRALRKHVLKHSEETRYNCLLCKQPFRRQEDLTVHMKRYHNYLPSYLFE